MDGERDSVPAVVPHPPPPDSVPAFISLVLRAFSHVNLHYTYNLNPFSINFLFLLRFRFLVQNAF